LNGAPESRKFRGIVPREPECPVNVDTFIIHNVTEDLFDRPFPFGISMQQTSLGDSSNEFLGGPQTVLEMCQYQAVVRQEVDVNVGIGWILCFSRLFNHSERSNVCPSHGTRSLCRRAAFNYHMALQTQWDQFLRRYPAVRAAAPLVPAGPR